ncbi:MAG: hypothetical protein J5755_01910 [Clostridia bacterium]|nr:hypothetical protein [Clostridia bacterium]
MRCNHCGTLIEGAQDTCPLCGAPVTPQAPVYPPRKERVKHYIVPFSNVYFFVALALTVVFVTLNVVLDPTVHYWLLAIVGLWYIYFSLRHSILGIENVYYKMRAQSVAMLIVLGVCGWVFHSDVLFVWVMPALYAAVWAGGVLVAILRPRIFRGFVLSLWTQSLLGAILPVLCWSMHLPFIPAVAVAALQLLTALVITVVCPKEVAGQLKREWDK